MLDTLEQTRENMNLVYPKPINSKRTAYLVLMGIDRAIAEIDLEMVKMKLADQDEGLGWSKKECDEAEVQYKRFLHLCKKYGKGIVPTKTIDQFWHYHILDTRAYCEFSEKIFGGYFHHYPYFGMRGEEDEKNLEKSFYRTKDLYQGEFGESLTKCGATDCWHDCDGRCWHACS